MVGVMEVMSNQSQPLSDVEIERSLTDSSTTTMWEELGEEEAAVARELLVMAERARQAQQDPGEAVLEAGRSVYRMLTQRERVARFAARMQGVMAIGYDVDANQPPASEPPDDQPVAGLYLG